MQLKASLLIEKDADGYFASCPDLKGCYSQGDTLDEAMDNMREAIVLHVETLSEDERNAYRSKEIYTTSVDVNVA